MEKITFNNLPEAIEGLYKELDKIKIAISLLSVERTAKPNLSGEELPINFKRALEIFGWQERTLRTKIAQGQIPYYQRGGKLHFFESELIKYIREGKIKANFEIEKVAANPSTH